MASMKHELSIREVRNFIDNGLRIKLTPGNPQHIQDAARAFQKLVFQAPDEAIQFLIDNRLAKLRIQKLKPQTDETANAASNKR